MGDTSEEKRKTAARKSNGGDESKDSTQDRNKASQAIVCVWR